VPEKIEGDQIDRRSAILIEAQQPRTLAFHAPHVTDTPIYP
jgi:hypothetical protein